MALSEYFTIEELECQLRSFFDIDEQWDIDFKLFFNRIEDLGNVFYIKIRGRKFIIDKITGLVTELED